MTIDTPHTSALHVQGLRFRYASAGDWIIDIPDLTLTPGQQVLLTGGSGRGKSTLLHLIAGLVEPNAGSIKINGRNIHQIGQAERDRFRGREIGMIFQTFNLLHGFTALENVMTALMFSQFPRNEHRSMASALLEHLGIERLGAQPHELSVGQQQRVAVARAVACRPALVLADEPTASLDPENAQTAITLIQQSCAEVGAALLCTSHDPSLIDRFEHRVSLDELSQAQAA